MVRGSEDSRQRGTVVAPSTQRPATDVQQGERAGRGLACLPARRTGPLAAEFPGDLHVGGGLTAITLWPNPRMAGLARSARISLSRVSEAATGASAVGSGAARGASCCSSLSP